MMMLFIYSKHFNNDNDDVDDDDDNDSDDDDDYDPETKIKKTSNSMIGCIESFRRMRRHINGLMLEKTPQKQKKMRFMLLGQNIPEVSS